MKIQAREDQQLARFRGRSGCYYYFLDRVGNLYRANEQFELKCIVKRYWYNENSMVLYTALCQKYFHIFVRLLSNKDSNNTITHYKI